MKHNYLLGEILYSQVDLSFRGFFIPEGTKTEIIEIIGYDDAEEYKVYFNHPEYPDDIECIQVLDIEELNELFN